MSRRAWRSDAAEHPFVSVVLPIRNEAGYIEECLERLLKQDYPAERFEVLVVDGDSSDGTQELVKRMIERVGGERLRLLRNPKRIVPAALNIGIAESRGEIIVRMDGHTVPSRDYVSSCVRALAHSGADNVGGPMVPVGDTPFGEAVAVAQQHPLGVGDAKFHFDGQADFVDTVYMGSFCKEIFARSGLFDESMVRNQDYELNVRIRKAGGRIYLDPSIRAVYTPRGSLKALWKQYFQYGWWRVETLRRHPDSLRWRQLVAPAFVLALAVLSIGSPFSRLALLGLGSLSVSYLLALALGAFSARGRLEGRRWLMLPGAFATMHLAWGLGFLISALSAGRFPYRAAPPEIPPLPFSAAGAAAAGATD